MIRTRISNVDKQILTELYEATHQTVDELPYTEEFERLYAAFQERTKLDLSRHEVWRLLSNARKASRLVKKSR